MFKSTQKFPCYLVVIAALLCPLYANDNNPSPEQLVKQLPLPDGVIAEPLDDMLKTATIQFSKKYYDFTMSDPFLMERRQGVIPEHTAVTFKTNMPPRTLFLFFKRFFNAEAAKPNDERTPPFYNSRSWFCFDEENEADIRRNHDADFGNAVFYRIAASGDGGKKLDIIVFRESASAQTECIIVARYGKN